MPTGIDSFTPVPAEVVRAAGHSFIARYLTDLDTSHKAKAWTVAQVAACRAAGLGVVAVWEGGGSDRTVAWRGGYDRGRRDARLAAQQAGALGRPEGEGGRPVYFAVDYDVGPADLPAVAAYFSGIASVFDTANVGIYGGRRAIEWAMSSGAARWFWQTGAWSADHRVPGIHLWQRIPTTRLGAYEIDIDDSLQADYGAWFTTGEAMAWCPFAKKMELLPESNSQAAIKPTQFILHSIAAPWTVQRIFEYWRDSTNLDSHFGLGFDGSLGQYIGTQTRADASAQANVRAISLESASNLQHTDPWTDAQVAMIIRLGVWLCQTHGIPARKPSSWDAPGIGYHRMYPQWSTGGTACPGDARVRQFDQLILPGIQRGLAGGPIPTTPSSGDEFDMASVEEVTNSVTAAVVKRLRDDPYPEATFELDGKPYVPRGFEVDREIYIFKKQVMDVLAEIRAAQSTPVPVQVDATAVAAAIAADKTLMSAIAKAVADEDHKRTEA